MKHILLLIFLAVIHQSASAQVLPAKLSRKMGMFPIIFLDSAEATMNDLYPLDPFTISNVEIVTPKKAKKRLGEKGEDGAIYVVTVPFARQQYWRYLSSKNDDYKKIVPVAGKDSSIQYIYNRQVLCTYCTGALYSLRDKIFKSLKIIDKATLIKQYGINDKQYGVVIRAKKDKRVVKIPKK